MNWWDVNDSYGSDRGKKSIRLLSLLSLFHLFALGRETLFVTMYEYSCAASVERSVSDFAPWRFAVSKGILSDYHNVRYRLRLQRDVLQGPPIKYPHVPFDFQMVLDY